MNDGIANLFSLFLTLLIFAVIGRSLMSWFPVDRNNQIARLLHAITEPLLEPVRRIMPRTGMIDLTPMAVIFLLYAMIYVVNEAAKQ